MPLPNSDGDTDDEPDTELDGDTDIRKDAKLDDETDNAAVWDAVRLDDSDVDTDGELRGVALGVPLSASVVVLVDEPASVNDRVGELPSENDKDTNGLADVEKLSELDADADAEGDVVRD